MNTITNAASEAVQAAALPNPFQTAENVSGPGDAKSTQKIPRDVFDCIAAGIPREQWVAALDNDDAKAWLAWLGWGASERSTHCECEQQQQMRAVILRSVEVDQLALGVVEAVAHLRRTMDAHEGLEYMVSCAADHAMAQPEQLGAMMRSINESIVTRLAALESDLSALQGMLGASKPAVWRV